jgi:hypothetical protein
MNCFDRVHKKRKEHQVCLWRFARREKIDAGVSCHAPVVVFAVSV